MSSLSDEIEKYLQQKLNDFQGKIKIKRNQLAQNFDCAPSQINYVLDTRFTIEKGYVVESQRGGGGFIRVIRVKINSEKEFFQNVLSNLDNTISQRKAQAIISRLYENKLISQRECFMMKVAVQRSNLGVDSSHRDFIRANILSSMLEVIFKLEGD